MSHFHSIMYNQRIARWVKSMLSRNTIKSLTDIWHHFYFAFFLSYKLMRNMQEFETPRWLFEGRPKRGKKVLLDGPAKKAIMRFYFFFVIFAILESNRFEKHCKILTRFSLLSVDAYRICHPSNSISYLHSSGLLHRFSHHQAQSFSFPSFGIIFKLPVYMPWSLTFCSRVKFIARF